MPLTNLPERHSVSRRDEREHFPHPAVVVAVDGGPLSARALAWAADEALCRGMHLRIVTVFDDPDHPHAPSTFDQALAIQHRLRRNISAGRPWLDDAEHLIAHGSVRGVLEEALGADDILVLGETGDVTGLFNSRHSLCPVVIVPAARP